MKLASTFQHSCSGLCVTNIKPCLCLSFTHWRHHINAQSSPYLTTWLCHTCISHISYRLLPLLASHANPSSISFNWFKTLLPASFPGSLTSIIPLLFCPKATTLVTSSSQKWIKKILHLSFTFLMTWSFFFSSVCSPTLLDDSQVLSSRLQLLIFPPSSWEPSTDLLLTSDLRIINAQCFNNNLKLIFLGWLKMHLINFWAKTRSTHFSINYWRR